jgi:hypothetical protein
MSPRIAASANARTPTGTMWAKRKAAEEEAALRNELEEIAKATNQ